jgi:hypothetical protein
MITPFERALALDPGSAETWTEGTGVFSWEDWDRETVPSVICPVARGAGQRNFVARISSRATSAFGIHFHVRRT